MVHVHISGWEMNFKKTPEKNVQYNAFPYSDIGSDRHSPDKVPMKNIV